MIMEVSQASGESDDELGAGDVPVLLLKRGGCDYLDKTGRVGRGRGVESLRRRLSRSLLSVKGVSMMSRPPADGPFRSSRRILACSELESWFFSP